MDEDRILRSHRRVHRDESILLRVDDGISTRGSKSFDEPSLSLQNAPRSSRNQRLSLDDEDVSFEILRVITRRQAMVSRNQSVDSSKQRVSSRPHRGFVNDEPVDFAEQEMRSMDVRVGPSRPADVL
jgi:hypothetical protein